MCCLLFFASFWLAFISPAERTKATDRGLQRTHKPEHFVKNKYYGKKERKKRKKEGVEKVISRNDCDL